MNSTLIIAALAFGVSLRPEVTKTLFPKYSIARQAEQQEKKPSKPTGGVNDQGPIDPNKPGGPSRLGKLHSGTWKMNPDKSMYSPGPAPASTTLKVEADEKGVKINAEGINRDGSPLHVQYDAKFDGKDYPVTGLAYADTVSMQRIDANTIEANFKKGGQVVLTITSKVSNDGKSRTSTFKGKDANGHDVSNVVVYDKQ
jgi:hypothetical protein